jgi:hypothetical protein
MTEFYERPEVQAAIDAVPEQHRGVFKALIESVNGHLYHDDAGTAVKLELERAQAALARLTAPEQPTTQQSPSSPLTDAQRNAAIRAEIDRTFAVPGKRLGATDVQRFWKSTEAKLFSHTESKPKQSAEEFRLAQGSRLDPTEKLRMANRADAKPAAQAVDPALVRPILPAKPGSVDKLRLANALRPDSSISTAIRLHNQFSKAMAGLREGSNLYETAKLNRDQAAARIRALGYLPPGEKF